MIFANANADGGMLCMVGPNDFISLAGAYPGTGAGSSASFGRVSYGYRDNQAFTIVEGSAGTGVTAVSLTLDDGTQVETTVANGWFLAWWPGAQQGIASVQSSSSGGTQSEQVSVRGPLVPATAGK